MVDITRRPFTIIQSTGHRVELDLREASPPNNILGNAREADKVGAGEGIFRDDRFLFIVRWTHGPIGEYHGTRGINGRISGTVVDLTNPQSQAVWFTDQEFR
jgi:hypothetical protein